MSCFSTSAMRFLEGLQKLLRKGDISNRVKSFEPCSHFSYPGGDVQVWWLCKQPPIATKASRRRAVAPEHFLTSLDTHRTGSLTPVSGQCGSDLWPQASPCHSGSARATSKKEVSVKHLLQRLPPISLHPLFAFMALLTISTLLDTPEFHVPTHEERL